VPRLHLVRHGRSEASWAEHLDPGLRGEGRAQAEAAAEQLAARIDPIAIRSSPLLRTQQTAAPLAERWQATITLDPAFGEIPSPSTDPRERSAWLESAMVSRWSDLGPVIDDWRARLLDAVRGATEDAVVFTHFVAINAVVGAADERSEVVVFLPGYASITLVDVDGATGAITIVERGAEATPEVG
jgi:broad specificity phosphatase PhoE